MPIRQPLRVSLVLVCVCIALAQVIHADPAAAPSPDGAAVSRVPWTTSRVVGSPEPPPPYQLQRAYPKLKFNHPLEMAFAPGSTRRFVAEHPGRILSFVDDEACATADLFFDATQVRDLKQVPKCTGIEAIYGFA